MPVPGKSAPLDRRGFLRGVGVTAAATVAATVAAGAVSPATASPRSAIAPRAGRMPQPTAAIVTRWDADPWARGGYSALPAGVGPGARRVLASRLFGRRIALAGEYCDHAFPSTVPGALRSGRAAATLLAEDGPAGSRVIVIGAGMAGLGAATELARLGAEVTVLEASGRVGGRIRTDRSWGVPVEEGAAWLHGTRRNAMVPLVRRAGLGAVLTDYDDAVARSTSTGAHDPAATERAEQLLALLSQLERSDPPLATSVGQWLAARGWPGGTDADWAEQTEVVQEFGLDVDLLGTAALTEGAWTRGPDAFVTGGYDQVPRMLASDLDVRLGAPVRSVTASSGSVRVELSDGSSVTADGAVVAVPLALLQAGLPRIRPWSAAASRALNGLTTGLLEKVALRFAERWWVDAGDGVRVIGVVGGRWTEWYDVSDVTGVPSLVGFCGGSQARSRPATDAGCVTEATAELAAAYGLTLGS